jgi:hypothetical protein
MNTISKELLNKCDVSLDERKNTRIHKNADVRP